MHKYAVIAFPFIFSNLRCFRTKICIAMPYYVKLSTLDIAKSYLLQRAYILTSLDQRTELTNERN
ncbi:hypothetical protein T12_2221 [Trichinella patagoniensis]|uniref:Uncharacterized protein n=1 Tax=Trichinella patagoniensis TaxID=990121 RepID=A0A0V1A1Z0_9BILA|nr:hypothetical protein T12_2221 [Trichinella patagoniensis]